MKDFITSTQILEDTLRRVAPLPSQQGYAKALASIFALHIQRNQLIDDGFSPDELPSASAIVVAPTGQGKTYLLRKMAQCLDLNVITIDCASLVAEGYKGAALSERILGARDAAKDEASFERSIIFIDEADKLAERAQTSISGGGMSSLLQLFNASTMSLPPVNGKSEAIATSRFTVLLGGAFEGLDEIIRERVCPKPKIGFNSDSSEVKLTTPELLERATANDLVRFGMMRELVGRIGTILSISPLGPEDYRQLLNAGCGSIRMRYHNFFQNLFGVSFEMSLQAVDYLAEQCTASKNGARAASPLVDRWMREAIPLVEGDPGICKIVLDACETGCYIRCEQGQRGYAFHNPARIQALPDMPWHTLKAKDVGGLARKLLRYYRNANGRLDVLPELEPFLLCTLQYMHQHLRPDEFTFESLEKLARATRRRYAKSPYDIIMGDANFLRSAEYMALNKVYTSWTQQNLVFALQTIMEYLQRIHGVCQVRFELFDPKQPPKAPVQSRV